MNLQMANELYGDMQKEATTSVVGKSIEFFIAVLITGAIVWAGYYVFDPGTLPIKQVRIEGEFRNLSTIALQDLVRNEVKGGFFNIDVAAVRRALLAEPWVRDVSVHRVWSDSLQVFVTEQVAMARWNDSGLLNKSGELFVPDKNTFPTDLPVLRGPDGTQEMMMNKYFDLYKKLEPLVLKITVLQLDDRRAWSFETENGLRVVLGRKDFEERVTRFVDLMPVSLDTKLNDVQMIDMRYPNGFAVRWRQVDTEVQGETGAL